MNIRILLLATAMLLGTIGTFAQAPANDDPCAAIPLTVSATCTYATYTNANATATAGVPAPGCASYSGGDVWFTFIVPASGAVTIDAIQGVITDGGMAVYSATACNGTFSLISCDDDNSANGLMPFLNIAGQTPGATLYIRFWEYGNNGNGTFGICVTGFSPPTPPVNDNPCTAIPVTVTNSCAYTQYSNANATATAGIPAPGCASYSGGDVWFSFTVPASGNVTLDGNTGVITDGGMAVYSATACNGTFTLIQCDDDNSANGLMPSLNLTGLAPGATMYVRFWEYGNDNNGTFSLCIFDNSLPPPPPNNTCLAPIPDICSSACNLGALPTPAPCTAGATISTGALTSFGMSNVGAIAENPYNAVVGCAIPATDVWYRFQATGTQLAMSITSLANALNNPNISLYNGNNCNALLPLGCFTGAGGSLAATFSPTTPGDFYYLQISGGNAADVGDFILNIRNNLDCATCLLAQDLQVTPPPVNGTYAAGQTVNFCFTVSNYNQTSVNWLHGIDLNFGAGWNVATLAPTSIPAACATTPPGGFWGFYNSVTSSHTPFGTYGPGFFFETSSGNPSVPAVIDGNPGNNFGDQGVGLTCPRTFCWQITTQPPGACTPGASLQVGINTLGDSESGIWSSNGCGTDPVVNFLAALACCAQPIITTTNASCGLNDGEIAATGQGSAPWDYVWANSVGTVIATHNNVNGTDSIGSLAAGNYSLTVTDNLGCSVAVSITVNGVATATAVAANSGPFCAGQTIALTSSNGGTGYSWNGPGGYTSTAQNPTLAGATGVMAGNYSVTVTYGPGCTATDVTNVVVNAVPVPAIAPVTVSICNGASATLTASGGNTYAWSNLANTAAVTVSPVLTTSYSVTVTDANFCTASMSRTVTVNSLPTAIINPAVVAICNGASATLTASGGTSYLWSNAGNTAAISVSPIITTSYTVTVTDANTCTATATRTVTVNPLPIPVINPAVVAICNGASATLTASGGTSYLWSNAGNTAAITVSPAITTSYTVTVTDVNTCTATATRTVTVNTLPTAIINPAVVAICNGASTTLTASGGTSYLWSNAANTAAITVSPIITTTYDVTVTDANACTGNTSRTVTVNTLPTAIINPAVVAICNGASATLTASGGTSYLWSNAANTAAISVSPVTTSSYTVTVTDANTCTATATRTVTVNSLPTAIINPAVVAICNGASATLTASGGTNYLWSNAGNTAAITVSPVITTSYTVTVTDANTCTATAIRTVTVNTLPTAVINPAVVAICNGASTTLTASGGTSYLWSDASITATITVSPIATTTYDVTVTDANACIGTTSRIVTVNPLPIPIINPAAIAICNGASVTITAGGGTNYLWSNAAITAAISVSPITTTTYDVTVTDANLCTATTSSTVTVNQLPTAIINPSTSTICNGTSATLTASGGTTYLWSDASLTAAITVSPIGTFSYSVTVTDVNNCTATASRTVTVIPTMILVTAVTDVACNGGNTGAIDLTANSGQSPYTFLWNDAVLTEDRNNIPAANYLVTVTDNAGCTATTAAIISEPTVLIFTETHTNVLCNGGSSGSIDVTANGGTSPYTYLWSDAVVSEDRNNIPTGNYSVTISDNQLCTAAIAVNISEPTALAISETHVDVPCGLVNAGSIDITVSGATLPYTYLWNDGVITQDRTNIPVGNYSITATDNNACSISLSATVSSLAGLVISETHADATCNAGNSGTIDVTLVGNAPPFTYLWNDGIATQDRTNLLAGVYSVTATDVNTCIITLSVTINQPSALVVTETHTNALCNGGSSGTIDVTATAATPPYTYLWNDGITTEDRNNIAAGNYSVTVRDLNLCSASITLNISEPTALVVTETHLAALCFGAASGSIDITASSATPPYTYLWNDAITAEDRTNIAAGNYSVVVNDFNSCITSIAISISQPTAVTVNETHTNALCNGASDGSINITSAGGTPGYIYLWNDAVITEDRTNISAGNYSVVVNDLNSCTATLSIVISEPAVLTAVEMHSNASCLGYTDAVILITVSGGTSPYSYLWDDGTVNLNRNNLSAGAYSITVTDNNSCTTSTTAIVSEPAGMALSSSFNHPTCETNNFDGSILLNVTGGSLPYHFDWSNGSVQSNLLSVAPGNYSVTVSDANNCTIGSTFSLAYIYDFTVQATPMATINIGESTTLGYTLNGNAGNYVSVWSPASTLSCADCVSPISAPNVTTLYQIEIRNDVGCVASDTVTVLVIPDYSIFVPNAFTPNNDGNNDVFRLFGNIKTISYLDIQVFNRIGEKVFESQDHNFGWDGTYKGVLQNPSVFIWQMKLAFIDGHREELRKGSVTLMR
ncbi:MAG: gliding motility-associated C-terminal domain-containing protein [Bacteroidetes bacterium]|nr:gliding motility-associated C-terminal domain-containing protein [Bacteroidota bacterium]